MDNRSYSRHRVKDVLLCLYADGINEEATGVIHDISEVGIGIFLPSEELSKMDLHVCDTVTFVFCDNVKIGTFHKQYVVTGNCVIRHIDKIDKGIIIGGTVTNKEYREYCLRKELALTRSYFA